MIKYHKIQTVFKRDPATKHKTLLEGQYSLPEFEYLAGNQWEFTEKVDGTNIRVMWSPAKDGFVFGGKSDNAMIPSPLVERLRQRFGSAAMEKTEFCGLPICLYGEGYGPKIQKGGGNYRSDQDFVLFDVKVGDWWLKREDVENVAKELGIDVVPVIGRGTLAECIDIVRSGLKSQWGDFTAEGIVARPVAELFTRGGDRIITKIKGRDFA